MAHGGVALRSEVVLFQVGDKNVEADYRRSLAMVPRTLTEKVLYRTVARMKVRRDSEAGANGEGTDGGAGDGSRTHVSSLGS